MATCKYFFKRFVCTYVVQGIHGGGYMDDVIIIYNRVPKTGSTSFVGLAYDLYGANRFHIAHVNVTKNSHILSTVDQVCVCVCVNEVLTAHHFF